MKYRSFNIELKDHGVAELISSKELVVLAIPDLHIPFHHPDSFKFLADLKKEFKPDVVVCLGDEVDFAALSFHDRDPDMMGARDEYESALEGLGELYKIFPDVLCCTSNHTNRGFRVAYKAGLPSAMLKGYKEFLQAPKGWSWHDRIVINNCLYMHGEQASGPSGTRKLMSDNRMSIVHGHFHSFAGVSYSQSPFQQIFGCNAGCLIDLLSIAFRYGSKYGQKGTLGAAIIRGGKEAHFIPMR